MDNSPVILLVPPGVLTWLEGDFLIDWLGRWAVASPTTIIALSTANKGPTLILLWAAANKCLSQLCLILQPELVFGIGFGDVPNRKFKCT